MISYIIGSVEGIWDSYIILENNGIGYRIFMPASSLFQLEVRMPDVKVHTYMAVREDDVSLYGFLTRNELDMFVMLLSVSGIGPKGALAILSSIDTDTLKMAIASGDSKLISGAKGVGSKTAQKIVVELKSRISKEMEAAGDMVPVGSFRLSDQSSPQVADAGQVLEALGFGRSEIAKAIGQLTITEDMDASRITAEALKIIE